MSCRSNSTVTPLCQGGLCCFPKTTGSVEASAPPGWATSSITLQPSSKPRSSLQACSQDVPGFCKTHFPAGSHTEHWNNCVIQGGVMGINYCGRWQEIDLICALIQYEFISRRGSLDSFLLQHIPISNIIHCAVLSATAKDIQKSNLKNLFFIL